MFFGSAKSERAKKYASEVFDVFDVDNSGELSYEGTCHLEQCANSFFSESIIHRVDVTRSGIHDVRETI